MKRYIIEKASKRGLFNSRLLHLIVLVLVAWIYANPCQAQDDFSIYYPSGDNKLLDENKTKLRKFIYAHNIKKIDSIQVFGFTDSTGKHKLNQKLSFKRASRVSKYLVQLLPKTVQVATYGMGEESARANPTENHRRVEVHVFLAGRALEDTTEVLEYFGNTKICFVQADTIMKSAHIMRVNDGRTNYVILEIEPHLFVKDQTYYTLTKNSTYAKVIKWKLLYSGSGWWRHERYRARVKEADFESYGVLTKREVPEEVEACLVCEKDMSRALKMQTELIPDAFIMEHVQFQSKWTDGEQLLIVPQEYVNLDKSYYFDKHYDHEVVWRTKLGLRNRPYLFATVPASILQDSNWNIYTHREICSASPTNEALTHLVDTMGAHFCRPESMGGWYNVEYGFELGFWNRDFLGEYLSLYGQYSATRWEFALHAGIDLRARFLTQLRADYSFLSFCPGKSHYIGNANRSIIHDFHRTLDAYVGSDLTYVLNQSNSELFHGLYLGVSYKNRPFSFGLDRVFAQVGASTNYLRSNFAVGIYFRIGLKFKI